MSVSHIDKVTKCLMCELISCNCLKEWDTQTVNGTKIPDYGYGCFLLRCCTYHWKCEHFIEWHVVKFFTISRRVEFHRAVLRHAVIGCGIIVTPSPPIHLLISLHIMIALTRVYFSLGLIERRHVLCSATAIAADATENRKINRVLWTRQRNETDTMKINARYKMFQKPIWHLSHTLFSLKLQTHHARRGKQRKRKRRRSAAICLRLYGLHGLYERAFEHLYNIPNDDTSW